MPLGNKLVILWTYADFMRAFYVLIAVFALLAWDLTLNDGRLFSATNPTLISSHNGHRGLINPKACLPNVRPPYSFRSPLPEGSPSSP